MTATPTTRDVEAAREFVLANQKSWPDMWIDRLAAEFSRIREEEREAALEEAARVADDHARTAAQIGPRSNSLTYWEHREVEAMSVAAGIRLLGSTRGTTPESGPSGTPNTMETP
jgi:hypothetical protein